VQYVRSVSDENVRDVFHRDAVEEVVRSGKVLGSSADDTVPSAASVSVRRLRAVPDSRAATAGDAAHGPYRRPSSRSASPSAPTASTRSPSSRHHGLC